MFEPVRAIYAFRPHAPAGLIAASVSVAALFASTPFILTEIADRFAVSLGTAGLISTVQVSSFAVASFLAGRFMRDHIDLLVIAAVIGMVGNLASAFAPTFAILLASRLVAGVAAGGLTWIAWADAVRDRRRLADIAATGPMTVIVAAPLLGWAVSAGGDRAVFVMLAAVHLPLLFLRTRVELAPTRRVGPTRPRRSNHVLLAALAVATAGGSSLWVFTAAFGTSEIGLTPVVASFAFSLNAVAGLIGARTRTRHGSGGWWLLGPAVSAMTLALFPNAAMFYLILVVWGATWWLAVPDVLRSIASHTDAPDGRMGDAQAMMALGRAAGPLLGGFVISESGFRSLGFVAGATVTAAALAVVAVGVSRRSAHRSEVAV